MTSTTTASAPDERLIGYPELLRSRGLRVTAGRLAVLDIIAGRPHSTLEEIRTRAIARLGSLSVQAVYDMLAALHAARIVRRVEPAGQPPRYELALDNHHHLMCRACGALRDVACHIGRAPCLTPIDAQGFVVDEAEVIYWGLCPACSTQEGQS